MEQGIKRICFYLPQFHPIAENNRWWGPGFTEWTNVTKAQPLFAGHYQPHIPKDLGFYDLRLPETRQAQADLARAHGIHGFCYYHYWFNGKRLLERPFNEVLASGEPDFPFCLCWANENWTRRWDGMDSEILMEQHYSEADDLEHINSLMPAFADDRYIKIDGRPLFLVYRSSALPDSRRTTDLWRRQARHFGFPDLYLCRVESFGTDRDNPHARGFDAAVEFQPDWVNLPAPLRNGRAWRLIRRLGLDNGAFEQHRVFEYADLVSRMKTKPPVDYVRFPCVAPGWDNSARKSKGGIIFRNSSPALYAEWLEHAVGRLQSDGKEPQLLFINAWNEWAEGCHLEPCQKWGSAYLETTANVLSGVRSSTKQPAASE